MDLACPAERLELPLLRRRITRASSIRTLTSQLRKPPSCSKLDGFREAVILQFSTASSAPSRQSSTRHATNRAAHGIAKSAVRKARGVFRCSGISGCSRACPISRWCSLPLVLSSGPGACLPRSGDDQQNHSFNRGVLCDAVRECVRALPHSPLSKAFYLVVPAVSPELLLSISSACVFPTKRNGGSTR
jgi:hypothetical protein